MASYRHIEDIRRGEEITTYTQFDPYGDKRYIDKAMFPEKSDHDGIYILPSSSKTIGKEYEPVRVFEGNERYDGEHSAMLRGLMSQRAMDAAKERSRVSRAAATLEDGGVRVIDDSTFPVHVLGKFGLLPEVEPLVLIQEDLGIKVTGGTREDFIALGRALEAQIAAERAFEEAGNVPLMGGEHSA